MIRTQVQLTEGQSRALEPLAAECQISVAELVRQSIDSFTARSVGISMDDRRRQAIAAIGRYSSGRSDVSAQHDAYLAEDQNYGSTADRHCAEQDFAPPADT